MLVYSYGIPTVCKNQFRENVDTRTHSWTGTRVVNFSETKACVYIYFAQPCLLTYCGCAAAEHGGICKMHMWMYNMCVQWPEYCAPIILVFGWRWRENPGFRYINQLLLKHGAELMQFTDICYSLAGSSRDFEAHHEVEMIYHNYHTAVRRKHACHIIRAYDARIARALKSKGIQHVL